MVMSVLTTLSVDETWTASGPNAPYIRMADHESFALDSHYDMDTGVLSFGSDRWSTRPSYNLSALASDSFVSAPFAATVRLGDQDGVNMPWFAKADATLLFWEIHQDQENAPLRLQVRKSVGESALEVFLWAHSQESVGHLLSPLSTPPGSSNGADCCGFRNQLLGIL